MNLRQWIKSNGSTMRETRRILIFTGIFFIALAVMLTAFFAATSNKSIETSETQTAAAAKAEAEIINEKMTNDLQYLRNVASIVADTDDVKGSEARKILSHSANNYNFTRLRIADDKGEAIDGNNVNVKVDISQRDYFKLAMEGKEGISDRMSSVYNEAEIFLLYTPITKKGKTIGLVYGVYEQDDIANLLGNEASKTVKNTSIIHTDGGIILPDSALSETIGENETAFDFIGRMPFKSGYTAQKMIDDISEKRTGAARMAVNGADTFACYTSFKANDWCIIKNIPFSEIMGYNSPVKTLSKWMLTSVMALFIFYFAVVFVSICRLYGRLNRGRQYAEKSNRRFKLALEYITSELFEYDVAADKVKYLSVRNVIPAENYDDDEELNYTAFIIQLSKQTGDIEKVTEAIERAKTDGSATATVEFEIGAAKKWIKFSIETLNIGESKTLLGVIDDVTVQKNMENMYSGEKRYRDTVLSESIIAFEINLTNDTFLNIFAFAYMGDEDRQIQKEMWQPYTPMRSKLASSMIYDEDRDLFLLHSSREYMLKMFKSGESDISVEYRLLNDKGEPYWVNSVTKFLSDNTDGSIRVLTYVNDIDKKKTHELQLAREASHDDLTGLLCRSAFVSEMNNFISGRLDEAKKSMLMIVDFDDFKQINDRYGHLAGDEVLKSCAEIMQNCHKNAAAARIGGDEFLVLLENLDDIAEIEKTAQAIIDDIASFRFKSGVRAAVSIGMAEVERQSRFDEIYAKADDSLYHTKTFNKGTYSISEK